MSRKFILFFISVIFFSSFRLVFAGVVINEVQYSPTTKQWVEIYNDTERDIDITTYKILDSGASTNGHTIIAFNDGTNLIPKHSFGVIAKAPDDFGTVSFPLFKSSLNIKVSEDKVILKNDSGEISSVNIDGSAIDGNSLQKVSGSWIVATPTPGLANETSSENPSNTISLNSDSVQDVTQETKSKIIEEPKIKTSITAKNLAFVGIPIEFQANAFGYSGEKLQYGKYFWNFGDGDSKEIKLNDINMQKFTHTYFYPGEYTVSLEYYTNYYGNVPDASNKITVKIVGTDIVISKVGDEKDFFVELTNNTDYDADISNWALSSNGKVFNFPRNTMIGSKKKMIISPKITNFSIYDKNNLKLLSPQGETIFDYGSFLFPVKSLNSKVIESESQLSVNQNNINLVKELQTPTEDIQSSAISSSIAKNNSLRIYFTTTILTIFLGVSAGAVYFVRKKKTLPNSGDDFKILDE